MSLKAMSWALDDVEGLHPTRKLVLLIMAEAASADGTGSFLGQHTIARKAGISVRQVRDHIKALHADGYIKHGDQRYVQHIPANYQPTVWDMVMSNTARLAEISRGVIQPIPSARQAVKKSGRKPTSGLDSGPSGGKPTSGLGGKPASGLGRKSSAPQGGRQGGSPLPTNQEPEEEPVVAGPERTAGHVRAAAPSTDHADDQMTYTDRHGVEHTGLAAWKAWKADRRANEAPEGLGHARHPLGRESTGYAPGDVQPAMTKGTR